MSMLLMLLTLSLFISSSESVTCYQCVSLASPECGDAFQSSDDTCTGDVCAKTIYEDNGRLAIHFLSFMLDSNGGVFRI